MSLDFEFYAARAPILVAPKVGKRANIVVDGPYKMEDEDIFEDFQPVIGKKRQMVRVHLEGQLTSGDCTIVEAWFRETLLATKGVLIDLQSDTYQTTHKSGKIKPVARETKTSNWMTFQFVDGEAFYHTGFAVMLERIAEIMPEALPKRFGPWEPMQYKIENGDCTQLLTEFKQDPGFILKAQTPFGHIFQRFPSKKTFERSHPQHFIKRDFLVGCVSFEIKPRLFDSPVLFAKLMELFEHLCIDLDVFYAEIIEGTDMPNGSWFWRGLPRGNAHTVCIGPPYNDAWPQFTQAASKIGKHHHIITTDRFGSVPPLAPLELQEPRQPGLDGNANIRDVEPNYAPVFPFDFTFDLDTYHW